VRSQQTCQLYAQITRPQTTASAYHRSETEARYSAWPGCDDSNQARTRVPQQAAQRQSSGAGQQQAQRRCWTVPCSDGLDGRLLSTTCALRACHEGDMPKP
jgi:hypothetical protein